VGTRADFAPMTETRGFRTGRSLTYFYVGWAVLFVGIAAFSVRTFVTAQDPFFYIGLAKTLLNEATGSDAFWRAFFRVAPGYPLLLAASMAALGDFGSYIVNPVFALVFSVSAFLLLRLRSGTAPPALMAALFTLLVLFFGYGLNIYFLLYPFREISAFALVFMGYALVERASSATKVRGMLVGSGTLIVLAAAIREPMLLCLGFAACRWLFTGSPRAKCVGWLFLPLGLAMAVAAVVYLITDQVWSYQARYVWKALANPVQHLDAVREYLERLIELARYVVDSFTWPGIALLALGLIRGRKVASSWFYFLVPAVSLLLFYAGIEAHRRYALSVIVFLCPIAGEGFAWVAGQIAERLGKGPDGFRRIYTTFCLFLAAALIVVASRQTSWGPSVTRGEVRRFQQAASGFISDGDIVYNEPASRYLGDALISYTDVEIGAVPFGPRHRFSHVDGESWYLQPVNAEAYYTPVSHRYPVSTKDYLRQYVDLVPHQDANGAASSVEIAGGRFEAYRIEAWSRHEVFQKIDCKAGDPLTIWLDFQSAHPGIEKTVRVLEPESGRAIHEAVIAFGNGLTAHFVPGNEIKTLSLLLEVRSAALLPSELVYRAVAGETPVSFPLARGRTRSVYRWFRPPFEVIRGEPTYIAVCRDGGRLCLPPVYGPAETMEALLVLDPIGEDDEEVVLAYQHNGESLAEYRSLLSHAPQWNSFRFRLEAEGGENCVEMTPSPVGCHGGEIRIRMARIRIR